MYEITTFSFEENGHYEFKAGTGEFGYGVTHFDKTIEFKGGMKEFGYWDIIDSVTVEFMSSNGEIYKSEFKFIDNNNLIVNLKGLDVLLERIVSLNDTENVGTYQSSFKSTDYTSEHLISEWYMLNFHRDYKQPISDLLEEPYDNINTGSAYIELTKDNRFVYERLKTEESGNWSILEKEGYQFLVFTYDDESGKPFWRLIEVTDTELFMKKGLGDELWHFTNKTD